MVTKADGGKWTYFYNQNNIVTLILDPYGGPSSSSSTRRGSVKEVDPNGNAWRLVSRHEGCAAR